MTLEEAKLIADLIEAKKHLHKAALKVSATIISQADPVKRIYMLISDADQEIAELLEYFEFRDGLSW